MPTNPPSARRPAGVLGPLFASLILLLCAAAALCWLYAANRDATKMAAAQDLAREEERHAALLTIRNRMEGWLHLAPCQARDALAAAPASERRLP